jgi:hypothetical protein
MLRIFWLENLKVRDHWEYLGVDGKIMLEWILRELRWESVDWMHRAEGRHQWRILVITVVNLRVP